jgi:ferric enterobactin receptor
MKKSCFFIILFAFAALSASSAAKNAIIAGIVLDKESGKALPFANVFFDQTTMGTASDEKGLFKIKNIPPGSYNLAVTVMGYKDLYIEDLTLVAGQIRTLRIKLVPRVLELGGVQVSAHRSTLLLDHERSMAGHDIISPRMISQQVGTFDDAYRSLAQLPSVSSHNDMNTHLYIRGGSPDQNLVLYDGIEIMTPSRLFVVMGGGLSLVNPDVVQSIDLAPGGFEVDYGNKMSGMMRIISRDGNRERFQLKTSASLLTARLCAEGPLAGGDGSWLLAARRSFYDLVANQIIGERTVFPFYYDLNARLSYDLEPDNKLIAFYTQLGEGARLYDFENEKFDLLNDGRGSIVGLRNSIIHSHKLATNLLFGYYYDNNSLDMYDTQNYNFYARLNYIVKRWSIRGDVHYYPWSWLRLKSGFTVNPSKDQIESRIEWRNYVNLPDSLGYSVDMTSLGTYGQMRFRSGRWLEYTLGVRYDYSTLYDETLWSPRSKLILGLSDQFTFWLSSGLYSQFPDLTTIISRGEPLDITANPAQLGAEESVHHIAGVEFKPAEEWRLKVELYHKRMQNLLVPVDFSSFVPENDGDGLAQGIEFSLQKVRQERDRFGFWLYYAFSEAKYRRAGQSQWIYFDYDQPHRIDVGTDFRLYDGFIVALSWRYGSGLPYTPIVGLQRAENSNENYLQDWMTVRALKNSQRLPFYARFDIRLAWEKAFKSYKLSAYIDLVNVLNRPNVYSNEWDFERRGASGGKAYKTAIYMMPFVPSFGFSLSF